jgi:hypothetical protein
MIAIVAIITSVLTTLFLIKTNDYPFIRFLIAIPTVVVLIVALLIKFM